MSRRLVYIAFGAAVGVLVVQRATKAARRFTPAGVQSSIAGSMSGNVSALTSLFAATLGSPIIKVAAFTYGVRSVASKRNEKDVNRRVREELKTSRRKP